MMNLLPPCGLLMTRGAGGMDAVEVGLATVIDIALIQEIALGTGIIAPETIIIQMMLMTVTISRDQQRIIHPQTLCQIPQNPPGEMLIQTTESRPLVHVLNVRDETVQKLWQLMLSLMPVPTKLTRV